MMKDLYNSTIQVALGCRVIVGVRNPDAVRKVFEDCGDAIEAGTFNIVKPNLSREIISSILYELRLMLQMIGSLFTMINKC